MTRRFRLAFVLGVGTLPMTSHAAPTAKPSAKRSAKPPKKSTAAPAARVPAKKPQTVIYALGASLFYQDLDGSVAREEKLDLPANSKIQYLTGASDGKTLAFGVKEGVYFYDTASKTLSLVAPKAGEKFLYPSISPDGQSVSCRPYRAKANLCILKRDGSVRDLGPSTEGITKSHFTADGKTIYFATGPHFWRISSEGGEAEKVVNGNYIENFSINKEGLIVAPIPVDATQVKPFLVDATGQKKPLTFESSEFYNPTWSPGGTSVAFSLRARYGGDNDAQGLYIWKDIKTKSEIRKVSDAKSNSESGFVWR